MIYGNNECKKEKKSLINKCHGNKWKGKNMRQIYHLVREVIKNPRNTVSSRSGARTPVMPTKQAVLQDIQSCPIGFPN